MISMITPVTGSAEMAVFIDGKSFLPRCGRCGARVAHGEAMTFSHVVDRVRAHFTEMPGLELTMPQAVRLLGFGIDDCRYVIDALVDAGFLRWTARRTIVRTGAMWTGELDASYVSVRQGMNQNRTVDTD